MQVHQQGEAIRLTERFAFTSRERDQRKRIALTFNDVALLRELLPWMEEHVDDIVEEFYAHLLTFEEAQAYFQDDATLRRVKAAQRDYLLDLCRGHFDEEYFERRLRIGVVHAARCCISSETLYPRRLLAQGSRRIGWRARSVRIV